MNHHSLPANKNGLPGVCAAVVSTVRLCHKGSTRMSVYVALHAFKAEQGGDISFVRGDSILVRTPETERDLHWWTGRVLQEDEDSDIDSDEDDPSPTGRFPAHSVVTEDEVAR